MIRTLIFCCSPGCVMFVDWCPVVRRAPPLTMQRLDGRLVLAEYGKTCRPGWRHGLITGCQGKTFFFLFYLFFFESRFVFVFFFFLRDFFRLIFRYKFVCFFSSKQYFTYTFWSYQEGNIFFPSERRGREYFSISCFSC